MRIGSCRQVHVTAMSDGIARRGRVVLIAQLVVGAVPAGLAFVYAGRDSFYGAVGGSLIAITLMLVLGYTMRKASELAVESPQTSMNVMYVGAVVRFVLVLVLFGIALGGLKLSALYTVAGFVGVMIVGVLASRGRDSGRPMSKTD